MRAIVIVLVLFLLYLLPGKAQLANFKFDQLSVNDGIPNRLGSVCKDHHGYMWFGGPHLGLYKYDGYKVVTYKYRKNQPGSLSCDLVKYILVDSKNQLWVCTSNGLNLFERETESFSVFNSNAGDKNTLCQNDVEFIFEDKKGNLWVATNGGLSKWNAEARNFTNYLINSFNIESLENKVTAVAQDSKGNIWVVTQGRGLYHFLPGNGSFIHYDDKSLNYNPCIRRILVDNEDKIWIVSRGDGLISFNPFTRKFKAYGANADGKGTNGKIIGEIIQDDERHILLTVDQGGVNRFDKKEEKFEYITYDEKNPEGLNNNGAWEMYKDNEDILWVLTSGGGVNYYNPKRRKFKLFRHNINDKNSLAYDVVGCFCEDSEGMIWIGTDGGGLDLFNPRTNSFKNYKNSSSDPSSISGNVIRCIVEDENKDLWIGTWDKGLNRFDRKTGKFYRYMPDDKKSNSISGRSIWHCIIDHTGILWLAVHNVSVDLFDRKKGVIKRFFPNPNDPKSLSSAKVWYVYEDNRNNIWLCTDEGLNRYDSITNSFVVYKHLPNNSCKAIVQGTDGNLWVGTESGVCLMTYDGTIIATYDEYNGLPGSTVNGLVCDKAGNIWISTNKGISKLNPNTKVIQNYTQKEGLQSDLFFQESFMQTRKGEIYFGGFKGFNSFHPDSIKINSTIPPVYITDFQIFNKPVPFGVPGSPLQKTISETREIELDYSQTVFSFGFTAINFTNPEKNRFAYKMEGFEKDWNYTDASRRYATYTNLHPGKYIFRVKACNDDGVWNEDGASVKIVILPPWWMTWWFRSICLAVAFFFIFFVYYWRFNSYRKNQKILTALVRQRTKELEHQSEKLLEQTEELRTTNDLLTQKQKLIQLQADKLQEVNQQLLVLNSTKDRFFSIIAHDLRNPFHVVSGFSELGLANLENYPQDKMRNTLQLINSSAKNGSNLLENLLQWARAQTGQISFEPVMLNLFDIINETQILFEGEILRKSLTFKQHISGEIKVWGDENMLKTIFRNLISNAIKFSHPNGIVAIQSSQFNSHLQVTVADTGVGIGESDLVMLFQIDTKFSTKGTANETGTGLGLILCKEFVERHNGKIWVESEIDKGSKFHFTLPLHAV